LRLLLLKTLNKPPQESTKTKKGGAIGTAFYVRVIISA
jgi:hypothetical protein